MKFSFEKIILKIFHQDKMDYHCLINLNIFNIIDLISYLLRSKVENKIIKINQIFS
jgi:hypothetical protein